MHRTSLGVLVLLRRKRKKKEDEDYKTDKEDGLDILLESEQQCHVFCIASERMFEPQDHGANDLLVSTQSSRKCMVEPAPLIHTYLQNSNAIFSPLK